jgi:hypothetical protein
VGLPALAARLIAMAAQSAKRPSPQLVADCKAQNPNFGQRNALPSCKLICGKGLLARRGCGVPRMMGTT